MPADTKTSTIRKRDSPALTIPPTSFQLETNPTLMLATLASRKRPAPTEDDKDREYPKGFDKSSLFHVSRTLQTRLQYARLKVEHGWTKNTLNEVEDMYKRDYIKESRAVAAAAAAKEKDLSGAEALFSLKNSGGGHLSMSPSRYSSTNSPYVYASDPPGTPTRSLTHYNHHTPESSGRLANTIYKSSAATPPPIPGLDLSHWRDDSSTDDSESADDSDDSAVSAAHTLFMLASPQRAATPGNGGYHPPPPTLTSFGANPTAYNPSYSPRRGGTLPIQRRKMRYRIESKSPTPTRISVVDTDITHTPTSRGRQPQQTASAPPKGYRKNSPAYRPGHMNTPSRSSSSRKNTLTTPTTLRWKHVGPVTFEEATRHSSIGNPITSSSHSALPPPKLNLNIPKTSISSSQGLDSPPRGQSSPTNAPLTTVLRISPPAPPIVNDQFRITSFVSVNGTAVNQTPGARGKNSLVAVLAKQQKSDSNNNSNINGSSIERKATNSLNNDTEKAAAMRRTISASSNTSSVGRKEDIKPVPSEAGANKQNVATEGST